MAGPEGPSQPSTDAPKGVAKLFRKRRGPQVSTTDKKTRTKKGKSPRGGRDDAIAKAPAPNPTWFVPVMLGLMIFGLIWVVVYYLSAGQFPISAWHNWNLLIGFAFIIAGFLMTTRWR